MGVQVGVLVGVFVGVGEPTFGEILTARSVVRLLTLRVREPSPAAVTVSVRKTARAGLGW